MGGRKHFKGGEVVQILKRHFVDKVPVSDLCDQYKIHPTIFYRWQKKFFEEGPSLFERGSNGQGEMRRLGEENESLKTKLARKDEVLGELMEEYVRLKKNLGEA